MNVLLIESETDTRSLLQSVLESRGHDVTAVADAETGWQNYQDRGFPLVVLNWQLPGSDGREVCRRIRGCPEKTASLILAITREMQAGELEQVLADGVDDILPGSIDIPQLKIRLAVIEQRVAHMLNHHKIAVAHSTAEATRAQAEMDLLKAKQQAEDANRAKDTFLGRMSHELRTPLNAIIGFTQIMQMRTDEQNMVTYRGNLNTILRSGRHLLRIIEDLLSLSAIETNAILLNIEDIDIRKCMYECFDLLSPLARERGVEFRCVENECVGVKVRADAFRLNQVLINLLANAIKFNKKGGKVTVSGQRSSGRIRIRVQDDGPGIPEDELSSLFQPFSRLAQRPYKVDGAGIGLSIAKQLIELMGGAIGVESRYGEGSTFWIELATAPAEEPGLDSSQGMCPPHEQAAGRSDLPTLLYIEDNPDHVELVRGIATLMGNLALLTAHTPRLGLDLARTHQPSLILLDICLPGMSGFEVFDVLQADESTRHIPVMALSASATPAEIEKGLRLGFRRYLTKPIDVAKFRHAVEELLLDSIH